MIRDFSFALISYVESMTSNYRGEGLTLKGKCIKFNNYGVEGLHLNGKMCEVSNYRVEGFDLSHSGGFLVLSMSPHEG